MGGGWYADIPLALGGVVVNGRPRGGGASVVGTWGA